MERPILTCPYCKEQHRLGYMPKIDSYHCWSCGNTAKRSTFTGTRYEERGRAPVEPIGAGGRRKQPVWSDE